MEPAEAPLTELFKKNAQKALAEISKAIEPAAEALWSTDPDKAKARRDVEERYRKAAQRGSASTTEGEVWLAYRQADRKFRDAAAAMLGSLTGFAESVDLHHLRAILRERREGGARSTNPLGDGEQARRTAADEVRKWQKAFARWSAPEQEIAALIASYCDRIDKLSADIAADNERRRAIFSFWFEVAPRHLQLRDHPVTDQNAPGADLLRKVFEGHDDIAYALKSGPDRQDGSLYLVNPDDGDGPIDAARRRILERWQDAAVALAQAQAACRVRPEGAAAIAPR